MLDSQNQNLYFRAIDFVEDSKGGHALCPYALVLSSEGLTRMGVRTDALKPSLDLPLRAWIKTIELFPCFVREAKRMHP